MHRSLVTLVISALLGIGCSAAHEPRDVATGIYDLRVRGEVDACSPSRATGEMGLVGIVSGSGVVNVGVPDVTSLAMSRVSLAATAGFHSEAITAIEGCDGASVRRAWTLLETTSSGFGLAMTEEWTGLAGCDAARDRMPAAPESDCRAERVLDYSLMETCEAPCAVRVSAGVVGCSCE
ncbi:hypothetical protein [Sandaracinus amylolyticus]|uniref:Lipoprotein n=1 Tax=Sandaracinus amylolyticus TaxID=927083 RepID=A0A0F6W5I6_9BACT|nr:hypothetical protein [Sandaracinus amylolyticus]AKF08012.1 hypothetical protein DB32_005161 [Sandaracinus amylolyticus]